MRADGKPGMSDEEVGLATHTYIECHVIMLQYSESEVSKPS